MLSPKELTKLGEKISKDYLEHNIPLNEGLEKVASRKELNSNQVDRVAESANVKTHLGLLKTAEDNYIRFDIADPKKVKSYNEVKTSSSKYDYQEPPTKTAGKYDEHSPFELAGEKLAEEGKPDDSIEKYNRSAEKTAEVDRLKNTLLESSIRLETLSKPIYRLCKQAALNGTSAEDLQYVIKEASEQLGSFIINDILKPSLSKDDINFEEKELEKTAEVNPENELYMAVQDFHNEAAFAHTVNEVYNEKVASLGDTLLEKRAKKGSSFIGNTVKGVFRTIKNHPYASSLGGVYLVGRRVGKQKDKLKNMPMSSKKAIRKRLPQKNIYQ